MQIVITGAAGFLGQQLAHKLLEGPTAFEQLLLVDIVMPPTAGMDVSRTVSYQLDLSQPDALTSIVTDQTSTIFHLAAVVSSHAESDFDLGWKVNMDITRNLLEACRQQEQAIRFVFASSLAVFGGQLPPIVGDGTAVTPQSSYGTQKAIGELMVNDYTRKTMVEGRVIRLPTVCVRPGRPNLAASSFVSSIIREPMNGEEAVCPVDPSQGLWLTSPNTVINNILHASELSNSDFKQEWVTVNLPGIGVKVYQMLEALERVTDKEVVDRVKFQPDHKINAIVGSWPDNIDNTYALTLGFKKDELFEEFIVQYIQSNKVLGLG